MRNITKSEIETICINAAQNSACAKRKVGAALTLVIEYDDRTAREKLFYLLAEGYNFNTATLGGGCCEWEPGHPEEGQTKPSVKHAEVAAIDNFNRFDVLKRINSGSENKSIEEVLGLCAELGITLPLGFVISPSVSMRVCMFVTHKPCENCADVLSKYHIEYSLVEGFMKFDNTKPRMALVPATLGIACARALTYGAKKYKPNNWRKTDNIEQYISALQRHFDAWREGESVDPESGLNHLDHMAANLCFLIELQSLPKIKG